MTRLSERDERDAATPGLLRFELRPLPQNREEASATPDAGDWPIIYYDQGQSLAQALFLSGQVHPPVLCSGLALCGRCQTRILVSPETLPPLPDETALLPAKDLEQGLRLACRRKPLPGMRIEILAKSAGRDRKLTTAAPATPLAVTPTPPPDGLFLALDLGTTTLAWTLRRGKNHCLSAGEGVNPQMGAGSDVMSRLAAASCRRGLERLCTLTRAALLKIISDLAEYGHIDGLCLAANPAMSAIALGLDPSGLGSAPYTLPEKGGRWFSLPNLPPLWLPPQLSPFVGGDLAAGYAALMFGETEKFKASARPVYPFVLADLGTNGELLLALSAKQSLVASVPMGPALEGAGLSRGTEARPGAASDFNLGPAGLEARFLPGGDEKNAAGITGSGALALLHVLLQCGLLDRQGRFHPAGSGPLARFFSFSQDRQGRLLLALPGGLELNAADVEELLKVKAAFSLALARLLQEAGLAAKDLSGIYVAGALGVHIRREVLANLGFFPPGLESRVRAAGNSALEGAALLAADTQAREALIAWSGTVQSLDLASDPDFVKSYPAHMQFLW